MAWYLAWPYQHPCRHSVYPVKIKVVGVILGHGYLFEQNWRPRLDAVEGCLNSWRSRALSVSGKALVVNALALSLGSGMLHHSFLCPLGCVRSFTPSYLTSFGLKSEILLLEMSCFSLRRRGFSVVSVEFKVQVFLAQWVRLWCCIPVGGIFIHILAL